MDPDKDHAGITFAAPAANDLVGLSSVGGGVGGCGELAHVVGVVVFVGVGHVGQVDGDGRAVDGTGGGAFKVPGVRRVVGVRGRHSETRREVSEVIGGEFDGRGGRGGRGVEDKVWECGEG